MLKIYFGTHPNEIYNTEVYYQNQYEKEWLTDEFVQRMIADIDDSQVISADVIQNNIFDSFPSTELSTGVKTLILTFQIVVIIVLSIYLKCRKSALLRSVFIMQ